MRCGKKGPGRFGQALVSFVPRFGCPEAVMAAAVLLLNVIFLSIVTVKNEFDLSDPFVLSSFSVKVVFDLALMFLIVNALRGLLKSAWPSAVFMAFYLLLSLANIFLYHFGNTMLERHHFALITPYSVTAYIPGWGFLVIFVGVAASILLFGLLFRRFRSGRVLRESAFLLLVLFLLVAYNRQGFFSRTDDEKLDRVIMGFRNAQVHYACRNQFLSLVKDVTFPALGSRLKALAPRTESFVDDYDLTSSRFKVISELDPHRRAIDAFNVPIGRGAAKSAGLKPFSRIILVAAESMSLDALQCFNPQIKAEYATRFFCRPDIVAATFSNIFTTGSPTLQGLTVIFNGHPNFMIQEQTGHPGSFPKLLADNGFRSVFIRSASKYFANENLVFRNMGFGTIIGREDFFEDESLRKYIYGWGLEDRILYRKALEYIEQHRDEKLFVTVFGTDTHPPYGQMHFKHLKYPPRPELRGSVPPDTYEWLRAVDAMDHDIDQFIRDLDAKGLFDERTLIVVMADHSCPVNNVTAKIPGHPRTNLARIPVVFLSRQPLPEADFATLGSQVDIAPTIFHLAGLNGSEGWWGDSLFNPDRRSWSIGFDKGFVSISDNGKEVLMNVDKPSDDSQRSFLDLFYSVMAPDRD